MAMRNAISHNMDVRSTRGLTKRNSPLRLSSQSMEASVPNERRDECPNPEHELLQRRQPPTDARVRDLRLVQRREHRQHADPHTREEPPPVHVVDVLRAGLKGPPEEEDDAANEDRHTSPHPIC